MHRERTLARRRTARISGAAGRPAGEQRAVDLRVVPDIDGKTRMAEEREHRAGELVRRAERGEFARETAERATRRPRLDAQHRPLLPRRADADERAAPHLGVGVEHALDLLRIERAAGGLHAMRLAADVPKSPGLVEITEIAHAVHDALSAGGIALDDLRERRGAVSAEVALGGARPRHRDFADLARR